MATSESKSKYIKGNTTIEGSDDIIKIEQIKDFVKWFLLFLSSSSVIGILEKIFI